MSSPAIHPTLQYQDRGHPIDRLPPFFNRQVGFPQKPVRLGRSQALVPQMDGKLEVLTEIVRKCLNLQGLYPFGSGHAQWKPDHNLLHVVITDQFIEVMQVVLLVFPLKRL